MATLEDDRRSERNGNFLEFSTMQNIHKKGNGNFLQMLPDSTSHPMTMLDIHKKGNSFVYL